MKVHKSFLGDWNSYREHSDVGNYIGCEFIRWLIHKYDIKQVCRMNMTNLFGELALYIAEEVGGKTNYL